MKRQMSQDLPSAREGGAQFKMGEHARISGMLQPVHMLYAYATYTVLPIVEDQSERRWKRGRKQCGSWRTVLGRAQV